MLRGSLIRAFCIMERLMMKVLSILIHFQRTTLKVSFGVHEKLSFIHTSKMSHHSLTKHHKKCQVVNEKGKYNLFSVCAIIILYTIYFSAPVISIWEKKVGKYVLVFKAHFPRGAIVWHVRTRLHFLLMFVNFFIRF